MDIEYFETLVGQPIRYYPLGPTHDSFVGVVQGLYETARGEALFLIYLVTRRASVAVPAKHCLRERADSLYGYFHNFLVVLPEEIVGIVLDEVRHGTSVTLHVALPNSTGVIVPAGSVRHFIPHAIT